jgi:hypothetical protein
MTDMVRRAMARRKQVEYEGENDRTFTVGVKVDNLTSIKKETKLIEAAKV